MQLEHFRPLLPVCIHGEDQAAWAKRKGRIVFSERTMQEAGSLTEWTLPALTNVSKAAVLHADVVSARLPVIGPSLKI